MATVSDDGNYNYGYNGQMKNNQWAGFGNHNTAQFWEYETRTGRRANQDPSPSPSLSNYAAFGNSPIWYNDVLGDTPRTYTNAEALNRTNIDKGGINTASSEQYQDALIKAAYDKKNKLVGYDVYSDSHPGTPIMVLDPGDIEGFKASYANTWEWAVAAETGDPNVKKIMPGILSGNVGYAAEGYAGAWKQALTDPGFVLGLTLSFGLRMPNEPPTKSAPRPSPNFIEPINTPAHPPTNIPDGHTIRVGKPTIDYPTGYWRQYNGSGQPVNPSTGKPPSNVSKPEFQSQTHVRLPKSK